MKKAVSLVAVVIALSSLLIPGAQGQSFAIDWFTIDGGGGTSSGGSYTLSGTIGQPDAGRLSGGGFTLDGGFWGGVSAVQQAGAPTLLIQRAGSNYTISWSPNTAGFVLQVSGSLSPLGWADAPSGATNPAPVTATPGTRFYRLRHP